jgi:TetR/AcrR family transcriptional regulator
MSSAPRPRLSREARQEQIVAAAREEFLTRGFAGARTNEVARAADVNIALVYKHFRSKEELFDVAVVAPLRSALEAVIAEMRTLPPDPLGAAQYASMLGFVRALLDFFTQSVPGLGVVLFGDRGPATEFYVEHIRPLIEASIEVGEVNRERWPHADYDIETAVQVAFGMAFWFAIDQSMCGTSADLDERARALTDIVMYGVAARTTRKGGRPTGDDNEGP